MKKYISITVNPFIIAAAILSAVLLLVFYTKSNYLNSIKDVSNNSSKFLNIAQIEMFTGNTMGTTYHIKVVMQKSNIEENIDSKNREDNGRKGQDKEQTTSLMLESLIKEKLKEVNQSMSVYIKESEISLFNKAGKGEAVKISPQFYEVMTTAETLYNMTQGAWDGTVKPLVDLWGFGTKDIKYLMKKETSSSDSTFFEPSSEIIKAYLQIIGFNQIIVSNTQQFSNTIDKNQTTHILEKKSSAVTLDLGSIAKGFGVDAVSHLLKSLGYSNFLVEIGGEVFASGEKIVSENMGGSKQSVKSWIVGIKTPEKWENIEKENNTRKKKITNMINSEINSYQSNTIYQTIMLKDKALATSGDYINFTIINGKSYSHIINPTTGYPVDNGVVSASVIADNCTFADGLATALMVMGHEKGIELVNTLENVECLIIVQDVDKDRVAADKKEENIQFKSYRSKKFPLP